MAGTASGLSDEARRTLRIVGVGLVLGAVLCAIFFFSIDARERAAWDRCVQQQVAGPTSGLCHRPSASVPLLLSAIVLLGAGAMACAFGFMRSVSRIVAAKTPGVVRIMATVTGATPRPRPSAIGSSTIKVRCRSCGSLEAEGVEFCSRCRAVV